jgi:hypothetical protein
VVRREKKENWEGKERKLGEKGKKIGRERKENWERKERKLGGKKELSYRWRL